MTGRLWRIIRPIMGGWYSNNQSPFMASDLEIQDIAIEEGKKHDQPFTGTDAVAARDFLISNGYGIEELSFNPNMQVGHA